MDMQKVFSLEGKSALVTGSSYGTGFVIAEALAGAVSCRGQYVDGGIQAYIGDQL